MSHGVQLSDPCGIQKTRAANPVRGNEEMALPSMATNPFRGQERT
jgi:hypothetical protein